MHGKKIKKASGKSLEVWAEEFCCVFQPGNGYFSYRSPGSCDNIDFISKR